MMAKFTLAATGADDVGGVLCSFDSKWLNSIRNGAVKVVFRKKTLAGVAPEWLYAYMGSPVSAITAKMRIESTEVMSLEEALAIANEGAIATEALKAYAGSASVLFAIRVGVVHIASSPVTTVTLSKEFRYFPSPNFIRLSKEGVKTIDRMARFKGAK